ncbi:MAG: molecular chaperone DnaJ [bacterium]|nr:molecular chaperone DnaJ [bacterium]
MSKDYYKILGVDKNASADEIKKAFRKLAHEHHPDKKGGNADKFKEANEAYSVLSDDKKRKQYDMFGSAGPGMGGGYGTGGYGQGAGFNASDFGFDFSGFNQNGFQGGGSGQGEFEDFDLGDILGGMFGGGSRRSSRQRRGADISVDVELPFSEAIFGVERAFKIHKTSVCSECDGSGAKKGSKMKTCHTCAGKGKIIEIKRSIIGAFQTSSVCGTCHGSGKEPEERCSVCRGAGVIDRDQEIKVKIPAGLEDGETIRLPGGGEAISGGESGDLFIKVHVREHSIWTKEGHNLTTKLDIKLSDALLGTTHTLKTLDGDILLKIPEGTTFGEILRVRGRGVPTTARGRDGHRGDILVHINIIMPKKLSREAKKMIEELKREGV